MLIAWAGVVPDLDALTALASIEAYARWHHVLTHGLFAAIAFSALAAALARARTTVFALAFAAFHLHLLCDFLGSGREWGITYLYPLSVHETFSPIGWPLASWQNLAITAVALLACVYTSQRYGRSFLEACLPRSVDAAVGEALRTRFAGRKSRVETR